MLPGTGSYLEDHIWEVLQENRRFTILFRDCFEVFHSKEGFENCAYRDIPKAVRVPLWVRLLGEAVSDCRWFTCQTQSSAYSMVRFVDATSFVQ